MGWVYGTNAEGRKIGYSVEAECDESACTEQIDHGLAYVCGGMHDGGDYGCGGYFCASHLYYSMPPDGSGQLCGRCIERWADAPYGEDES